MVPRRYYEQNLFQSCGKVATKRVFSLYFNVNLMMSQWRQLSSKHNEITYFLEENVSTVIFVSNPCTFIAYLQSTEEKELLP